jgi:hypothetical protein
MWPFRRKLRNPIRGSAYVAAATGVPPRMRVAINIGSRYRCVMDLVVEVEGREPYAAQAKALVDPNRPIEPGMTLPVLVDRDDPLRIEVVLDAVTSIDERTAAAQEAALAEARARRDD